MSQGLSISDLHVAVDDTNIIQGVSLDIQPGEIHVLMGPNGSGKSTLAGALMGHPSSEITKGSVSIDGEDISSVSPDIRAKKGLFFSMQYPPSISGVSLVNFLRTARNAVKDESLSPKAFRELLAEKMETLEMNPDFANRSVNEGFSGGEKKRAEILQLLVLEPRFAVLDETDSGLDVDALRTVASGIQAAHDELGIGILLITHYTRILEYLSPDYVHVMQDGEVVRSGGPDLAKKIEESGFASADSE